MNQHRNQDPSHVDVRSLRAAHEYWPDYDLVISIEDREVGEPLRVPTSAHTAQIILDFDDVEGPVDGYTLAGIEDVRIALEAARVIDRVLVHCVMGQARSAAIGLAIIADRLGPGHEAEACDYLERMRAVANGEHHVFVPNLHVLQLADDALGADGRLRAAWLSLEEDMTAKGSAIGRYRQWRSSPLAALAQEDGEEVSPKP